jgi:hypothetical protein
MYKQKTIETGSAITEFINSWTDNQQKKRQF